MNINEYVNMAENILNEVHNIMRPLQGVGHAMKASGAKINSETATYIVKKKFDKSLRVLKIKKYKIKRRLRK